MKKSTGNYISSVVKNTLEMVKQSQDLAQPMEYAADSIEYIPDEYFDEIFNKVYNITSMRYFSFVLSHKKPTKTFQEMFDDTYMEVIEAMSKGNFNIFEH